MQYPVASTHIWHLDKKGRIVIRHGPHIKWKSILDYIHNHAAPLHCLNKLRHCTRLAVYFIANLQLTLTFIVTLLTSSEGMEDSSTITPSATAIAFVLRTISLEP